MSKPFYISKRIEMYDRLKAEYDNFVAQQERKEIKITWNDGESFVGIAWETTPSKLMRDVCQSVLDTAVVVKVNGEVRELDRLLTEDCTLEFLDFENIEGQQVFWHSSAHVLGEALELEYSCNLCYGPPIEEGFYYDMFVEGRQVKPDDYKQIETKCKKIVKEKQKFERLEMKIEDLLEMFSYNEFKCRIIKERVKTATTTVYRCGDLIDLCQGPHVPHTGKIKAMAVTKNSASYWEGNQEAESLQRVYGISFPDPKQLKEWTAFQIEAAKRDHRKIGEKQHLFFFNELSPGSCFFEPKGTVIYKKLVEFITEQYRERGFDEVITPTIFNSKLWERSGHWEHYKDNMFLTEVDKAQFALKPMNCPGHCMIFSHRIKSYRDLPLRLADFGVLHRNEASGALSGLTRVRRFQQDDAHIFCREDQISQEIESCLGFIKFVYGVFGFEFRLNLSTRPEKYLGDISVWNKAENQLKIALDNFGYPWALNEGDGAFYGPKIDITITDALKRQHQCATIQLDFQLPERFDLSFMRDATAAIIGDGEKASQLARPVIIHRAILGSVERMMAILIESYGGKWPFWLSPFQAIVLSFNPDCDNYALSIQSSLKSAGFHCDVDVDASRQIKKKILMAQEAQYNFMLIVGKKEVENKTINVRTRDNTVHDEHTLDHIIDMFKDFSQSRIFDAEKAFK